MFLTSFLVISVRIVSHLFVWVSIIHSHSMFAVCLPVLVFEYFVLNCFLKYSDKRADLFYYQYSLNFLPFSGHTSPKHNTALPSRTLPSYIKCGILPSPNFITAICQYKNYGLPKPRWLGYVLPSKR